MTSVVACDPELPPLEMINGKNMRQDRCLLDLAVVTLHRGCGQHLAEEKNDQPGRAFFYHAQERDGHVGLIQRFHTAELLDVLGGFLFRDVEHVVAS